MKQIGDVKIDSGKLLIVDPVSGQDGATLDIPETGVYPIYQLEAEGMTFIAVRTGYVSPSTATTWGEKIEEEMHRLGMPVNEDDGGESE